ncbi:DedA family protein [Peribacillus asahii]|uniref:DedA family protein n=1 Tax=Peribacillus asahii TaxID=228899 RepID=A0A398B6K6_9BACI|nr:DedA family protein [Peribacillus asahii]RID85094.1 DedA family protein [Peribacillus asahii]
MNSETILQYIDLYGYLIIFLFLFFGIVGIPAPEESLLFFIGVLIVHHQLSFGWAILCALLGTFIGMLTAFLCGKYIGYPFIHKYGKYVGITSERWEKVQHNYTKNAYKTILFGFYMPGIRQMSPYFAGIAKISFGAFFLFSLLGTLLWVIPFILAGYYLGQTFNINPVYVPYLGILFLAIFFIYMLVKYIRKKRLQHRDRVSKKVK